MVIVIILSFFRCLHYFSANEKLQSHVMDCEKMNDSSIRLPSEDDRWLEFGNYNNRERVPFIVYADLECVLRKTKSDKEDASSYAYQQHDAFSIGYYVRCAYDDALSSYHFHRDEDCIAWFARQLNDLAHRVKNIIFANVWKPMETLSKEQLEAYRSATRCHICEKPFTPDDTRVHNHCLISPIDFMAQRMQIAILIIKIHFIFRSFFTIYRATTCTL